MMDSRFPTLRSIPTSWWPWYTTAAQSQSLLRLIAVAIEEKLPPGPLLESWAADENGVQRYRIRRLVRLLNNGIPLPEAVEQVPGVLRDEDLLSIRFDAQSGTRTAAIRARLDTAEPALTTRLPGVRQTILYFCIVIPVALLLVAFTQISVIPKLLKILREFSIPQPHVLQWSLVLSGAAARYGWLIALAILAVLSLSLSSRMGRLIRRTIVARLINPWQEIYAAEVLQLLGVAAGAGRPLAGTLSTLARYHFDPRIRHKLLFVRNEVEQEADVWQSLTTVGLLSPPDVQLLNTAERVGNRPWALSQIVASKRRRTTQRWERRSVFLLPVLVLAMGVFVLFQAFTLFVPLVEILRSI